MTIDPTNVPSESGSQTVWIARHGNRADFVDPDWASRADRPHDPPLSDDGEQQARQLAERLAGEGIGRVVASPFLRTVQTAHIAAARIGAPMAVEPGVCEWLNPDWFDGPPDPLPLRTLKSRFPNVDLDYEHILDPRYPEPSGLTALDRAGYTARLLVERYPEDLLIVGHGVTVAGAMLGLCPDAPRTMYGMCALVKLVREGSSWRLELNGDTSHLDAREDDIHYH